MGLNLKDMQTKLVGNFMRILLLSLLILVSSCVKQEKKVIESKVEPSNEVVVKKENVLTFNISTSSYPPYMIHSDPVSGIMVDVIKEIGKRIGKEIEFVKVPRKRTEIQVQEGSLDIIAMAVEWLKNKENYVWTDGVVPQKDVVFIRSDLKKKVSSPQDLYGMTIGAHIGYVFPSLTEHFESKKVIRNDVRDELQMIKMMYENRLDGIVGNEVVIKHLISINGFFDKKFVLTDLVIGNVPYRYAVKKGREELMNQMNNALKDLEKEGILDKIINSYQ